MSRAHLCREESRVGGCCEGPSMSDELCDGAELLLAPLPTPPEFVVPTFVLFVLLVKALVPRPVYWIPATSEALIDIARFSVDIIGAVTRTYSRSIVSMESPKAPANHATQAKRMC